MLRAFVLALTLVLSLAAHAEPRTALVIGNSAYSYAPLINPVNDATDMASALEAGGFEVTLMTDADRRTMDEAIAAFGDQLKEKGGVGLFYYSGHGVAIGGDNYMLPVGEALSREDEVKYKAVNAGQVIDAMAGNQLNIVILDSCRNNPLAASGRSVTRGLARVNGGSGLFVSFATSPGEVALDGQGRNSPYTKHLVASIRTPGLTLEEAFKQTLKGVYQETDGKQIPWISSSFFGDFYFLPEGTPAIAGDVPPPSDAGGTPTAIARLDEPRQLPSVEARPTPAGVYHATGVNPNGSQYRGMATITPSGDDFRFDWWIGKQVFHGVGRFAGRMLVVEWGDKHPVVYTFPSEDKLDGEWADGSATETLSLFANAAPDGAVTPPGGRYQVKGSNPDGSRYTGSVTIMDTPEGYRVDWVVGSSTYQGVGVLEGNVFTVDWGSDTPVVYALAPDGTLSGLWAAGKGEETLAPVQ